MARGALAKHFLLTLWLLAALTTTGCTGGSTADLDEEADGETERSDLVGEITIDGSSTVQPLSTAAAEAFIKDHPNVQIPVATSGTGGGFKKFVQGQTDISNASRPITPEEFAACRKNGVEFLEIPVAYDGLTIVVNRANDWVQQLTIDQIKKIYLDENAPKTWQEVDPAWPDEPLKVYSPGTDSGTFDYFREVLGGKSVAIRSDMQTSEDDNVLVQGVEGDKGAIAYFGAAYAAENDNLRQVPIVNPATGQAELPTGDKVESGDYAPYSRPLFIYVNLQSLERPEVKLFVEQYLERAGDYAAQVGYFPLPPQVLVAAKQHVETLQPGTTFVTADGQPRPGAFIENFRTENLVNTKSFASSQAQPLR